MKPEDKAREKIDEMLRQSGWVVQSKDEMNLRASLGVAVTYYSLKQGNETDYLLFLDGKVAGILEAKKVGEPLSGVSNQTNMYRELIPDALIETAGYQPPFLYESNSKETFFRDVRDPEYRQEPVFSFHRPETLLGYLKQDKTLRARLQEMPPLPHEGLRDCQIEAIESLEDSFSLAKPNALIQMASGGGKTFTAVNESYRLVKYAKAKRVLFLVDRTNLGIQTQREFDNFTPPDENDKFSNLYITQRLTSNVLDPSAKVVISTIQRIYSILKGDTEYDIAGEEESGFEEDEEGTRQEPKTVVYNPNMPPETFDFIIVDECHRSIYNLWKQVFEYFDAFVVGLTATPSKSTLGFFNQNLVTEYTHERAVADKVNVDYDVYVIKTLITQSGASIPPGFFIDRRNKLTRERWQEVLDEELGYGPTDLNEAVVAENQIRLIIKTFKDKIRTEIFPGRKEVPKTLVFAKNDNHAEDIVRIIREEFGKGEAFCKKITYKVTGVSSDDLISEFRHSPEFRIAVTVDLISTGIDVKPLECLLFMRNIKSSTYFDQMKGRGVRVINDNDFQKVTPDAECKDHFVIVDAIGVCVNDKSDSRPLDQKPSATLKKLLDDVASGVRDSETLSSLSSRLSRLNLKIENDDISKDKIIKASGGKPLSDLVNPLLETDNPDKQEKKAEEMFGSATDEQKRVARRELVEVSCSPFDDPVLRKAIIEVHDAKYVQTIDIVTQDELLETGFTKEAAEEMVTTFKQFIEDNKDELDALQIIYGKPYLQRNDMFEQIEDLRNILAGNPYHLAPELVWKAYEKLDESRVRNAGPKIQLTNIISLIRFSLGLDDVLEPFADMVERRFEEWVANQEANGKEFTEEQMRWLVNIKNHIATSLGIDRTAFDLTPFVGNGGLVEFSKVFGSDWEKVLDELNEVLVA